MLINEYSDYIKLKDYDTSYFFSAREFVNYCGKNKVDIINMTLVEINKFILYLRETKKVSNGTVNNYINHVKFYYKYLIENDICNQAIFDKVLSKLTSYKVEQKVREYLLPEELPAIIRAISTFADQYSPEKIRAILYFMLYTGIRKDELLKLQRDAVDLDNNEVHIKGPTKNNMERMIPFPKRVGDYVMSFFMSEPEEINAFNLNASRMRMFFEYIQAVHEAKHITPHCLRHSFARMLANAKPEPVDVATAQMLLGHKDIQTTLLYYKKTYSSAANEYRKKIKVKGLV